MFNDAFNERSNYIHNAVDKNRLQKIGPSNIDSSFAQMNVNSHKSDVETVQNDQIDVIPEVKGDKDNFVIRNKNIMNAQSNPNPKPNEDNFVIRNNNFINSQNMFRKQ